MKKKPVVLVLNQFALPLSRGGGTRHAELFGRLSTWDASVLIGSRHYFDQSPVNSEGILHSVFVPRFNGNGAGRVLNWASFSALSFAKGLPTRNLGVVYGSSPHLGSALSGYLISRVRRVAFVLEIRDLWPQILLEAGTLAESSLIYRVLKKLELFLYGKADRIVVLAEGSGEAIRQQGFDPGKIVFLPNGADPSDFEVPESREALRAKYQFSDFTVVYAGAHGPANGLELVLDSAEQLLTDGKNVRFVLFGDGVSKSSLRSEASRRGLRNVEFRDPLPKTEIIEVFKAADAGLHCLADVELFKTGVSPNKLYDYMAAGLPSITNTGGDVATMVNSAGAGVAVAPDQIHEAVRRLLAAGPEELTTFGQNGKRFMEANRSRTAMAIRLEQLLEEVSK